MTLALAQSPRPIVRDWSQVMAVKDAAVRLGVSVATLQRRCQVELSGRSLAFMDRPAEGGKAQWFIDRSYDARLQPSLIADRYAESDLTGFNEKQRNTAFARRHCVLHLAELERTRSDLPIAAIVRAVCDYAGTRFPTLKISRSSLYAWRKAYKHPCDLAKLVDERGGDRRSQGSIEAWAEFRKLFLNDHQPAVREVWKLVRNIAADNGWKWCTLDSCRYQLDTRVPPQEQTKYRQPAKYRSALAPYIESATDRFEAGACWVGDHKQIDLICTWRGQKIRPWLTAWMDWRTRKIVGYVLSASPNSHTILAAFRRGMLDTTNRGGPEHVWIDNGKDYAAWIFHGTTKQERREKFPVNEQRAVGIFDMLGIRPHFSLAYNPNGKARLERFFGNFTSFARHFATYCGRGVGDKPESLASVLKDPAKIPTFAEVERRVGDFIAGYNANPENDMSDMSEAGVQLAPADAFGRWCKRQRSFDASALDLCLEVWSREVRVGRNGITVAIRGLSVRYGQYHPALAQFKAATKAGRTPLRVSYDSADVRTIKVWTTDMKFVATVEMNRGGRPTSVPISADLLADQIAEQRHYDRIKKTINKEPYRRLLTIEEQLAIRAYDAVSPPPAPAPADSMRMVPTPLDGEGKAIAREKVRIAAGAENHRHADIDTLTTAEWMASLNKEPARPRAKSWVEQLGEEEF